MHDRAAVQPVVDDLFIVT